MKHTIITSPITIYIFLYASFFSYNTIFAVDNSELSRGIEPDKVGNFLLPLSQQPFPLYGFGQNFVKKNEMQGFLNFYQIGGKHINFTALIPRFLYGITEKLTIFASVPVTITSK